MIKFEEDKSMKTKNYLDNCTVSGNIYQLIIIITYDEYKFPINDKIWRVWTCVEDIFLQPKEKN